jgi:hypothetical protein
MNRLKQRNETMDFTTQKQEIKALLKQHNVKASIRTTHQTINVFLKSKGNFEFPNVRNGMSFNKYFNNGLPETTENFIKKIHAILSKNVKTVFEDDANQETILNYYSSIQAQFN